MVFEGDGVNVTFGHSPGLELLGLPSGQGIHIVQGRGLLSRPLEELPQSIPMILDCAIAGVVS